MQYRYSKYKHNSLWRKQAKNNLAAHRNKRQKEFLSNKRKIASQCVRIMRLRLHNKCERDLLKIYKYPVGEVVGMFLLANI